MTRHTFKLSLTLGIFLGSFSFAGGIRTDVDFQQYLDYAENRGRFKAGATNVPVYKKDGSIAGYIDSIPDFSGNSDVRGNVTMFNERYGVSVGHMTSSGFASTSLEGEGPFTGYERGSGVTFNGEKSYYVIAEKRSKWDNPKDYYVGRFHKLVTSTRPLSSIATKYSDVELRSDDFPGDKTKFGDVVGVGAGRMSGIAPSKQVVMLAGALGYKTGGITISTHTGSNGIYRYIATNTFDEKEPLYRYVDGGDSGSPLYIYDKSDDKWYLFAAHSNSSRNGPNGTPAVGSTHNANIMQSDTFKYTKSFISANLTGSETIAWNLYNDKGEGTLTQGDKTYKYIGMNKENRNKTPDELGRLRLGGLTKDLVFTSESKESIDINLVDSINLGAGALYFEGNYIIQGKDANTYFVGAGLDISEGKKVTWTLKGIKGDSLHKVGKGTLLIQGSGDNLGDASIGDGSVLLNQSEGKAFDKLEIVSGRAIVKLLSDNQLDFDKLYFGSDGGVLDLNGHDITLTQFNAYDKGANITNTNVTFNTITLNNTRDDINPYKNENSNPTFKKAPDSKNSHMQAYHGRFSGNANLVYKSNGSHKLIFDGGVDSNGRLDIKTSGLTLQGNPVLHAYNKSILIDAPDTQGNSPLISFGIQPSASQSDWETNTYIFKEGMHLKENASLDVGYHAEVKADATLGKNATLNLGIKNGDLVSVDRLYGVLYAQDLKSEALKLGLDKESYLDPNLLPTSLRGDITLATNSTFNINSASFTGSINPNSSAQLGTLNLDNFSALNFTKASTLKALNVASASLNFNITKLTPDIPFIKVSTASFSMQSYINIALPELNFFATYLDKNYTLLNASEGISYLEGATKISSNDTKYVQLQTKFKNNINFNTNTTKGLRQLSDTTFITKTLTTKDVGFKITTTPKTLDTIKSKADLAEEKAEAKRQEELKQKELQEKARREEEAKREEKLRLEELLKKQKEEKVLQEIQKESNKPKPQDITEAKTKELLTKSTATLPPSNKPKSVGEILKEEMLGKLKGDTRLGRLKEAMIKDDAVFNGQINKGNLVGDRFDSLTKRLDSSLEGLARLNLPTQVNKTLQDNIALVSGARMIKAHNPLAFNKPLKLDTKTALASNINTMHNLSQTTLSDINANNLVLKTVLDVLELDEKKNAAWINLIGARRTLKGAFANIYGVSLGYDRTYSKGIFGVYGTYATANTDGSFESISLDNRSQNYEVGIYGNLLGVLLKRGELDLLASFNIGDNQLNISDTNNLLTRKQNYLSTNLNTRLRYGLNFKATSTLILKPFLGLGYTLGLQHKPSTTSSFLNNLYVKNSAYLNGELGLELRKYFSAKSYLYFIPSLKQLLGLGDSGLVLADNLVYKSNTPNNTYIQAMLGGELELFDLVSLGANVGYIKGLVFKDDSLFGTLEFKLRW
ncbi:hypothetical protein BKH43_05560 [Helicobacter sp. 13S00401-1]|uniref:S6 family peptidase n=1 Tax=Helicobacter sp. 13S00401-1 TaxID=1905758 RepID=UPI000BA617CF|nr:S6 family peptidase [Helicobacter sp. 13S00401-1]PAF50202.1 hypothetical protein BKH43_05560 [Helicobacter sp. 13S00401-1]